MHGYVFDWSLENYIAHTQTWRLSGLMRYIHWSSSTTGDRMIIFTMWIRWEDLQKLRGLHEAKLTQNRRLSKKTMTVDLTTTRAAISIYKCKLTTWCDVINWVVRLGSIPTQAFPGELSVRTTYQTTQPRICSWQQPAVGMLRGRWSIA